MGEDKPKTRTFIRTASGLVREYGAFDTFLIGTFVTWGLLWAVVEFPWYYGYFPGANLPLALLIVAPPFVLYGVVYWLLSVSMPRAGSDYMWVSRTVGPWLGFAWCIMWFVAFFQNAFVYPLIAFIYLVATSIAVPGLLFNISWLGGLASFLLTNNGTFALGILIVLIFAVFTIVGGRIIRPLFYIAWVSEIIGIIIMWGLLATTTPAMFAKAWDASALGATLPYGQVIAAATKQGYHAVSDNNWGMTIASLPLASLFFFGYYYQTIVAGEIKDIKKSIPLSIFGVFAATYVWWAVSVILNLSAFGSQWFYAISYLWENAPAAYPSALPTPTINLFLSLIAYPNAPLMGLIAITFILTSIPMVYVVFLLSTRYFFAWGFDRLVPTRLAQVHPKYRTPVNATIALTILTAIWLGLYLYTGFGVFYTMSVFQMLVTFMGPSIAAFLIPYVRKNLFESLPPLVKTRIAGVPVISIVGLLCTISFGYLSYLYYITPQITTSGIDGTMLMVGSFVLGIVIYLASRAYWRSKGVRIDLAFKELPPD